MNAKRQFALVLLVPATLLLGACVSGPDYSKPDTADLTPPDWRWKVAEPGSGSSGNPAWASYHDAELDRLEQMAMDHNESLKSAQARVRQAFFDLQASRSGLFPSVGANASFQHQRLSGNRPMQIEMPVTLTPMDINSHAVSADASYELDLWGRVRRSNEAYAARFNAQAEDLRTATLALNAELASDYFQLRGIDEQISILEQTEKLRAGDAKILQDRFEKGLVPEIDASRAQTQLAQAQADLADASRQRARLVNAMAVLCGKAPAAFDIGESREPLPEADFDIRAGIPSAILEQRPDVAAAEMRLIAQNAQIGVAKAAYFPSVNLVGSGGYLSTDAGNLLASDSATWSFMPQLYLPLFTAGKTQAEVNRAKAACREAVADFRQSILVAFQDVEDALSDLANLAKQAEAQGRALQFARQTQELAEARYKAGYVDYMTVADAKRDALAQELSCAKIKTRRYMALIALNKALGCGWTQPGN